MSETFEQALARWQEMAKELKRLQAAEMTLRKQLFEVAFPNPTEGVNKLELADGTILKGDHKINRTLDEAAVPATIEELRKASNEVVPEEIFKAKFSLATGPYKKLSPELLKIADRAIVAKPGSPALEVV